MLLTNSTTTTADLNQAHSELALAYAAYLQAAKQLPTAHTQKHGHSILSLQGGWQKLVAGHQSLLTDAESHQP